MSSSDDSWFLLFCIQIVQLLFCRLLNKKLKAFHALRSYIKITHTFTLNSPSYMIWNFTPRKKRFSLCQTIKIYSFQSYRPSRDEPFQLFYGWWALRMRKGTGSTSAHVRRPFFLYMLHLPSTCFPIIYSLQCLSGEAFMCSCHLYA